MGEASAAAPTVAEIEAARELLGDRVRTTPAWRWQSPTVADRLGAATETHLKLELFQRTGTFKARGALLNLFALDADGRRRGVTAVSAGNHAIAVAFAAGELGSSAKVVMPSNANPARVALCRRLGAEVVLVEDVHAAFAEVERIESEEGRAFIHPFEGEQTVLGTAGVGLELCRQIEGPALDAVVVPIGGGGLCAGVASAVKQSWPSCRVIGVEPEGADSMHLSFVAGAPQSIERVRTIADSLGAPHAAPYTYGLCRRFVDGLVKVSDPQLLEAMLVLFEEAKLAVEPAGAAATAALLGPLSRELAGSRVGLIVCGSNIDHTTFAGYLERAAVTRQA